MFRPIRRKSKEISTEETRKILKEAYVKSAVVFGRCHLMEDASRAEVRLRQFAMKYYPNEELVSEEIAVSGKAVRMYEIEIEHMSGKEVQER